jgi:hypothetical protein
MRGIGRKQHQRLVTRYKRAPVIKKEVPPNIGFLKEKTKFGKPTGSSTRINCNFSKRSGEAMANAGSELADNLNLGNLISYLIIV